MGLLCDRFNSRVIAFFGGVISTVALVVTSQEAKLQFNRSDEGLTLETSAILPFTVANLRLPIYFIITTFVLSKILSLSLLVPLGLHGLCFAHEHLRQLHNQSHENPKRTRLGHVLAVPPVSHGSVWNFFCSYQQLQGEKMSSYFLSAVVNTSILS